MNQFEGSVFAAWFLQSCRHVVHTGNHELISCQPVDAALQAQGNYLQARNGLTAVRHWHCAHTLPFLLKHILPSLPHTTTPQLYKVHIYLTNHSHLAFYCMSEALSFHGEQNRLLLKNKLILTNDIQESTPSPHLRKDKPDFRANWRHFILKRLILAASVWNEMLPSCVKTIAHKRP